MAYRNGPYRILLVVLVMFASPPTTCPAGIDLDSLFIVSVGGLEAVERLKNVETIRLTGAIVLNGMPGRLNMCLALPDMIYQEISVGSISRAQAYNGSTAWQKDLNGKVSELSGYEKRGLLSQLYVQTYSHIFDDRLQGSREYLGIEVRDGHACHKVAFYPLNQDTVFTYFDIETGRSRFDVTFLDNLEAVTEYSEHRKYESVLLPFHSRFSLPAAQTQAETTIDTIIFNSRLDRHVFEPPSSRFDYSFPSGAISVQVPFELVAGRIFVMAVVNGKEMTFMLDSGASANMYNASAIAELGLPTIGTLPVVGVAGYEEVDLVQTDSVVIGDLVLLSQVGGSLDLTEIGQNWKGEVPFGGVLGFDFLSRFPVLVDYAVSQLTVYNPDQFEPPVGGHQVGFEYTMQIPTIEAELVGIPGRYIVDLGNTFGLIVHNDYSHKHDLQDRLDNVEDIPQKISGVGGGVRGQTAYAATFSFGDILVSDLRVMLPDSAAGLSGSVELAGNIGNLLLKQFRVLFDYASQRLVFYEIPETGD